MDYIINKRYADHRHGTGVQLKLFADRVKCKPLHICWDDNRGLGDTYRPVCNLNTSWLRVWPLRRGRGLVGKLEASLGLTWHNPARIAKQLTTLSAKKGPESRAYVIIASEGEAQVARMILDFLQSAYVVNVMDYLHLGATELSDFPHFAAVLKGAKRVFALTPPIQRALAKICDRKDISILSVAREPARARPRPPVSGSKSFEIVMMGSVDYTRGLQELTRFCSGLEKLGVNYCLNYIGTQEMRNRLGSQLPVRYQGVRLGAQRDAMLNSMHAAYLPGPDGDPAEDYLACFSFPSRLTDYFWHGLPVVGPLFNNTATAQMLSGLSGNGVWFSQDPTQLAGVVESFLKRPHLWGAASEAVYKFAEQHFSIEKAAKTIQGAFDN